MTTNIKWWPADSNHHERELFSATDKYNNNYCGGVYHNGIWYINKGENFYQSPADMYGWENTGDKAKEVVEQALSRVNEYKSSLTHLPRNKGARISKDQIIAKMAPEYRGFVRDISDIKHEGNSGEIFTVTLTRKYDGVPLQIPSLSYIVPKCVNENFYAEDYAKDIENTIKGLIK